MGFDVVYGEMHWKNYALLSVGIRLKNFQLSFLAEGGTAQSEEDKVKKK